VLEERTKSISIPNPVDEMMSGLEGRTVPHDMQRIIWVGFAFLNRVEEERFPRPCSREQGYRDDRRDGM
jgi:hypothetical protein